MVQPGCLIRRPAGINQFVGNPAASSVTRGRWAESLALEFLLRQGLKLLARNFQVRCGEVDLILEDGGVVVFCEVRYRANHRHVHALETIDARKRSRIINTSYAWLQAHQAHAERVCRFDVVVVDGSSNKPGCQWIKNAFQA